MILLSFLFVLTTAAGTGDDGRVGSVPSMKNAFFVITDTIDAVSSMEQDIYYSSSAEKHFGVEWNFWTFRGPTHLELYLVCHGDQGKDAKKWSIEASVQIKIREPSGYFYVGSFEHNFNSHEETRQQGWGGDLIRWDELMKMSDDTITVEIRVKVKKITGVGKKHLMSFDEDRKQFSDVVLVVDDRKFRDVQKFYVSKTLLASQSPFFENLLLRDSEESEKPEIVISDIDSYEFQTFVELLHGESPIDDYTIEGIFRLSDKHNVKNAIQKCEKFVIENSGKELDKFQLAYRYNLDSLRDHCLSEITSGHKIRSVLTNGTSEMDPFVVAELLQKSVNFHVKQNAFMLFCFALILVFSASYLWMVLSRRSTRS